MEFEIISWLAGSKSLGRVFEFKADQAMREASGLRPLERRFRADESFGSTDGFRAFQQRR
jgi:hypothetical protein